MMMLKKNILLGTFFLTLQIFILLINDNSILTLNLFWVCNHIPLLLALSFYFNKKQAVKGLITAGFIGQFIWALDFLSYFIISNHLFGFTSRVMNLNEIQLLITLAAHFLGTFVALLATYKDKIKPQSLKYTYAYLLPLFFLTYLFTPISYNINCIHEICGLEAYTFSGYTLALPFLVTFILIIPGYYFQKLLNRLDS